MAFLRPLLPLIQKLIGTPGSLLVFWGLLLVILMPKPYYFRTYFEYWSGGGTLPKPPLTEFMAQVKFLLDHPGMDQAPVEAYLESRVQSDECILYTYGWHVAPVFIYSKVKPCTRFFLPNIVGRDWQKQEYRESVMAHPPVAILYGLGGADLNWMEFSEQVLNISQILEECYAPDLTFDKFNETFPSALYWAKYRGDELKACFARVPLRVPPKVEPLL